ncbi:MAG: YbaK/EbsC family protein [Acidobacteriota bacterium]
MRWSELTIPTLRDEPSGGGSPGLKLLIRAGYARRGDAGLEYLDLGRRSLAKLAGLPFSGRALVLAPNSEHDLDPERFATPGVKSIADLAVFTGQPEDSLIKSVVMAAGGKLAMALLRGDHALSEAKLRAVLGADVRAASPDEIRNAFGADPGSLGPVEVTNVRVLTDEALRGRQNLICGANQTDYHLRNVTPDEDFSAEFADLSATPETPESTLTQIAQMGRDESGLVMPPMIAPFSVLFVPVNVGDDAQRTAAEKLYEDAKAAGCDALLDDRDQRPGVKFKDAELIGIPWRVTLGKKLAEAQVEIMERRGKLSWDIAVNDAVEFVRARWDKVVMS